MKRRDFITLLSGAAAGSGTWPTGAHAQQPAMPVIGYLGGASLELNSANLASFRQGLAESGYVEGRNVTIAYRWAEGDNDRLPTLAADLVRSQVSVIATPFTTVSALAAKAATRTIPIVFLVGSDPVEIGLVESLNRPGGNLTGVSILNAELTAKRLEFLHEVLPGVTAVAFLRDPTNPVFASSEMRSVQIAAQVFKIDLLPVSASTPSEIDSAFGQLARQRTAALLVSGDVFFRPTRGTGSQVFHSHDLRSTDLHRGWRPHELRNQPQRCGSLGRRLHRANP